MNFRLEKIDSLSGDMASVYSVILKEDDNSLFEQFLEDFKGKYPDEINDIVQRLIVMGHNEGMRDHYFKLKEGRPGDLVCALYDRPDSHLRLYAIRFGHTAIILGGGGFKPEEIRAWQNDPKLKLHAEQMIEVSDQIFRRMNKEISWSNNTRDLEGDLTFYDEEYDE